MDSVNLWVCRFCLCWGFWVEICFRPKYVLSDYMGAVFFDFSNPSMWCCFVASSPHQPTQTQRNHFNVRSSTNQTTKQLTNSTNPPTRQTPTNKPNPNQPPPNTNATLTPTTQPTPIQHQPTQLTTHPTTQRQHQPQTTQLTTPTPSPPHPGYIVLSWCALFLQSPSHRWGAIALTFVAYAWASERMIQSPE